MTIRFFSKILLVTLLATQIQPCNARPRTLRTTRPNWTAYFNSFVPIGMTCAVGAATGAICAYSERTESPLSFPWSWLFFPILREMVVEGLVQNSKKHDVPHNKTLAHQTARLFDWITYLYLWINHRAN